MLTNPLFAVIGANFGDEGKGREVDRLVSRDPLRSLVVRHNSGSQAGHTVESNGIRHIFSHFGSGTLIGAPTLLCHKFVVNPIAFNREYDELISKGIVPPKVYVTRSIRKSTPLDMLLNQIMEMSRGANRHGSCGMGFGETIHRYELLQNLGYSQLEEYFLGQIEQRSVNLTNISDEMKTVVDAIKNKTFQWSHYNDELDKLRSRVSIIDLEQAAHLIRTTSNVVFEGAQGLMLHQDHEYFPHVTRCRTGIEDVRECLQLLNIGRELEIHYCTRPYLTRHGAGPLLGECSLDEMKSNGYNIVDNTNISNEYQGSLRFAPLDMKSLVQRILHDSGNMSTNLIHLAVSCADQVPSNIVTSIKARSPFHLHLGWNPDSAQTQTLMFA